MLDTNEWRKTADEYFFHDSQLKADIYQLALAVDNGASSEVVIERLSKFCLDSVDELQPPVVRQAVDRIIKQALGELKQ
jgi:hypothetical protein